MYDDTLADVQQAMNEPAPRSLASHNSGERLPSSDAAALGAGPDPVGLALRAAEVAIDDLVVLANQYNARMKICQNPKVISHILAGIDLIASIVELTNERPSFRVIHGKA